jgi:hypothetical protein
MRRRLDVNKYKPPPAALTASIFPPMANLRRVLSEWGVGAEIASR